MKDDELKALFKKAAEISKAVPESLREAAFNRAVDALIGSQQAPSQGSPARTRKTVKRTPSTGPSTKGKADPLLAELDRTAYPQMQTAPRVLERALILLRIAKDDFDIDGLGSSRIAKVLTKKFRYRTTYQAVQQALDAASDKVDRVSIGRKTLYRIMSPGETYLDQGQFETASRSHDSRKTKKTRTKKVKARKASPRKTNSSSKRKKQTQRTKGATTLLKELLEENYFSSPHRIADIKDHLEHKKGRFFKVIELSTPLLRLLRDGLMERIKAEDGQYEYKSH